MQKAIIHTATRVVRRLTTDDSPVIEADETVVEMDQPITISGFTKLNEKNEAVVASETEAADAGVNLEEVRRRRKVKRDNFVNALDDLITNTQAGKMKTFLQGLKEFLG